MCNNSSLSPQPCKVGVIIIYTFPSGQTEAQGNCACDHLNINKEEYV